MEQNIFLSHSTVSRSVARFLSWAKKFSQVKIKAEEGAIMDFLFCYRKQTKFM